MQYAIIVYETQEGFAARTDVKKQPAYWAGYRAYGEALAQAGVIVGGAALQPDHAATTLRLKAGERLVQDGPYADTKEQLGGFYLIDVPDLDTALDWAARCPGAASGVIEVRPVLPMGAA